MSKRWDSTLNRYIEVPDYGPDIGADNEIWVEQPVHTELPTTLADHLRAKFNYHFAYDQLDTNADHNYLIDAGRILPLVEALIQVAATADQLLNCASEFTKDLACCAEYFQAADDKLDALKKEVGP